jgi:hypothetical protein
MKGVPQPPEFHPEGDVWTHTLLLLENLPAAPPLALALAALLHDVGKPPTFTVTDRIRFNGHAEGRGDHRPRSAAPEVSHRRHRRHRFAGQEPHALLDLPRMGAAARKRFFRLPHFDQQLELYRLDLLGGLRPLDSWKKPAACAPNSPKSNCAPRRC